MPVHVAAQGTNVIENATGRVVAKAKSRRKAHIYASIRNREHAKKMARRGLHVRAKRRVAEGD